jgi:LAO/AO transport system kinase
MYAASAQNRMIDASSIDALAEAVRRGDRRSLARAITLVESTRPDDRAAAESLLARLLPHTGGAVRLGLSGPPGVGKSTLVEALGLRLVHRAEGAGEGRRVAVLAIDPSSPTSGGSLLGDKTRMEELQRHPRVFVRPQPAGKALGGTAARTGEALLVCEAAGFDVVIVETVGVGQSEHAVRDVVDTFALLVPPGGGDELQGIKRGVLELVDIVVINKADGERLDEAERTRAAYEAGSRYFLGRSAPLPVLAISAHTGDGVDRLWAAVVEHRAGLVASGALETNRAVQAERALWRAVEQSLLDEIRDDAGVQAALPSVLREVREGTTTPLAAAAALLRARLRDAP